MPPHAEDHRDRNCSPSRPPPHPTPATEEPPTDPFRAAFSYQYRLLNAGIKLTNKEVGEVWMEMLKAPVTSAAAASQAALDEPVAVKVEVED